MKSNHLLTIALNFFAVILLLALIATPIYFAKNFSQVAGVKSQSPYLVVSQVEKFPGMTLTQDAANFQISFTKQGVFQAYLGILIINNPTNETRKYSLQKSSASNKVFFGEDLQNQLTQISMPPSTSVPVSILSSSGSFSSQTVKFTIQSQ